MSKNRVRVTIEFMHDGEVTSKAEFSDGDVESLGVGTSIGLAVRATCLHGGCVHPVDAMSYAIQAADDDSQGWPAAFVALAYAYLRWSGSGDFGEGVKLRVNEGLFEKEDLRYLKNLPCFEGVEWIEDEDDQL